MRNAVKSPWVSSPLLTMLEPVYNTAIIDALVAILINPILIPLMKYFILDCDKMLRLYLLNTSCSSYCVPLRKTVEMLRNLSPTNTLCSFSNSRKLDMSLDDDLLIPTTMMPTKGIVDRLTPHKNGDTRYKNTDPSMAELNERRALGILSAKISDATATSFSNVVRTSPVPTSSKKSRSCSRQLARTAAFKRLALLSLAKPKLYTRRNDASAPVTKKKDGP
mmetsp:Transcript_29372/g.49580  ORF Transcript_29372/g.49580 Transcript_29372/m.49580 type:complete len:221 (-) Transcript_29372:407-1069(-)